MTISFEFPDSELEKIKAILLNNLSLPNETELNDKLNALAQSAFAEYVGMISESGLPSKVTDIMQARTMYLIEHYFKKFPNETDVAKLFNIPTTKGRTLLTNLKSSQRNKLNSKLESGIRTFLISGTNIPKETKWEFIISSKPIILELNEIIALEKPGLSPFTQKPGSAGKVIIPQDSYDFLKTKYKF